MVTRLSASLLLGLTAVLLAACSVGGRRDTACGRAAAPDADHQAHTAGMDLHRIPFCDLLPARGGPRPGRHAERPAEWGDGDASRFVGGTGDRAQEFGCRY